MDKVNTGRELAISLAKVAKELKQEQMVDVLSKLSIDAFRELVLRSAADTGYLRSNWAVTVDRNSSNRVKNSGETGGSYRAAEYPNQNISFDSVIHLYNNTEYAIYLEEGTPKMRAQPMVEPTYLSTLTEATQLAAALSKEKSKH